MNGPDLFRLVLLLASVLGAYLLSLAMDYRRLAKAILLIASFAFAAFLSVPAFALLALSVVVNFFIAGRIEHARSRAWLSLGVCANLGMLTLLKLLALSPARFGLVLPIGISFYTIQQVVFLVDVYRGHVRRPDFLTYGCFTAFFPKFIAGPIPRAKDTLAEFQSPALPRAIDVASGVVLVSFGLFKKVVLAGMLSGSPIAPVVGAGQLRLGLVDGWLAIVAYGLYLYFDFSGYSDIALGVGRFFAIRLPLNFDAPYAARNIAEFWRHWHMSFTRILTDYLYFALPGARGTVARRLSNLVVVMVICGFWHGAAYTFLIWGLLHGVYLAVYHLWRTGKPATTAGSMATARGIVARVSTLMLVMGTWAFFGTPSLAGSVALLRGMAGLNGILRYPSNLVFGLPVAIALLVACFGPSTARFVAPDARSAGTQPFWQPGWRHAIACGALLFLVLKFWLTITTTNFAYAGF